MSFRAISQHDLRLKALAFLLLVGLSSPVTSAHAADEPDLIFRRSTVFKLLSPNDKLATYGVDDPEVAGVACHFTVPQKGGYAGWLGSVVGSVVGTGIGPCDGTGVVGSGWVDDTAPLRPTAPAAAAFSAG